MYIMKKFLNEFKTFAMRGNVIDLAVGVVMGSAFGKITNSVVNDIIMPVISVITGGLDFSQWKIVLKQAVADVSGAIDPATEVAITFGNTISVVLDFIIIAFAIFCMVKGINKLHRKKAEEQVPAPAEPTPSKEEILLSEIRDLLKNR